VSEIGVSRRNLICGFAAAGVAVPLVAACGGSGSSGTGSSGLTVKTSEIPVGGGKVFSSEGVLVTQPKAGEFRVFSSSCTHQGATLNPPVGGVITCPLHGSQFSAEDGHNERGPNGGAAGTTADLPEKKFTQSGDTLTIA
jgi:Rieske Fe-S protein